MSLDDHSHCTSCVLVGCTSDVGCLITKCDQDCGAAFHWCKTKEHANICPKAKISCTNKVYGCKQELLRQELNAHLSVCSASVVYCSHPQNAQSMKRFNLSKKSGIKSGQQTEILALNEPMKSNEDVVNLPKNLRKFGIGRLDVPLSPLTQSLHSCSFENTVSSDNTESETDKISNKQVNSECQQMFQRDKYPWHAKNVHSEISDFFDEWFQQKCPFALYGCSYVGTRYSPDMKGSEVVYNPLLGSFGVRPVIHHRIEPSQDKNANNLTDLPLDVLEQIAENLDGFSLNNLALTCVTLQNVCLNLLQKKGVVLLQWQKDMYGNKPMWYIDGKRWIFPNSICPIKSWKFHDVFAMTDHIKNCPYNKSDETEPFRVLPAENSDTKTIEDDMNRIVVNTVSNDPANQPIWTYTFKYFDNKDRTIKEKFYATFD